MELFLNFSITVPTGVNRCSVVDVQVNVCTNDHLNELEDRDRHVNKKGWSVAPLSTNRVVAIHDRVDKTVHTHEGLGVAEPVTV